MVIQKLGIEMFRLGCLHLLRRAMQQRTVAGAN